MVQIMHIFADYCTYKGWGGQFLHLDGSTKAEDRTDMIVKCVALSCWPFGPAADPPCTQVQPP